MPQTAQELISLALQTVSAPGWTSQAGQQLNIMLADLADNQDLDLCRGKFLFNFVIDNGSGNGSGPYALPADYKRAERAGVFYVYNGVPYYLRSIDYTEYLLQVQQAGIADFPVFFATDISPQGQEPAQPANLYVWPPSSSALPCTVIYRRLLPDIITPEISTEIPWFPNQGYLVAELEARMAKMTNDPRSGAFFEEASARLRNFMQLTNDDEGRSKVVTLDSRRFGRNFDRLPNTKNIGW